MTTIETAGIHHVRLTVTNLERSLAFYRDVLGFAIAVGPQGDYSDPAVRSDQAKLYGGVVFKTNGMLFGLRPVADPHDRFVSERVGLDHLSFKVSSIDELAKAATRLDAAGVERGEIIKLNALGIAILSIQDPDGINLELTAAL
jgi:catechol 2,3-dioxygenase-like lactoylglutathione lyase family enzyme